MVNRSVWIFFSLFFGGQRTHSDVTGGPAQCDWTARSFSRAAGSQSPSFVARRGSGGNTESSVRTEAVLLPEGGGGRGGGDGVLIQNKVSHYLTATTSQKNASFLK